MAKRLFDILFSTFGLILTSPLFAIVGAIIKLEDGGPVFYKGERVGLNGKPIKVLKFRTMVYNADKIGGPSTADDDPRITRIGNFIRKYKLDELPQFINVLSGDMSIVGPRPEVRHYVDMFTDEEKKILTVKPGITDWASIWNPDEGAILKGSPDPEKTYMELIRPNKIRLQLKYVEEGSIYSDLIIIFKTAMTVIKKEKQLPTINKI